MRLANAEHFGTRSLGIVSGAEPPILECTDGMAWAIEIRYNTSTRQSISNEISISVAGIGRVKKW